MKSTFPFRFSFYASLLAASTFAATTAQAQSAIPPLNDLMMQPGSAGMGVMTGVQTSPYRGAGTRYDLLPLYLYEGERFFLHANRVGVKLLTDGATSTSTNTSTSTGNGQRLDLFVEQRAEGFPVNNLPVSLSGMALRKPGVDFGLSYRYRQPWGTLQADLLSDVSQTSRGSEAQLSYAYDWRSGPLTLRPSVTFALRDAKLNNYYYGVLPGEATASRPAYAAGAGINTTLGVYGAYDVSQNWRLLAGVSATVLSATVKNSPLVQRQVLPAIYVGAAYDFGGHKREWAQADSPTYFKLLYGKSTENSCHLARIITAQCLSTANVNSTSIAGIQVGKPFIKGLNGWPVDVAGYLGLTHHNENGLQANGAQLDAFMKATYTGFPWSSRVKTRLGLGLGLSAAQRVPYTEVNSQGAKTTSRLLQYLDPTIDISLGDLIGSRALKETYLGFGVSHRSGVFGASRLFGNVNGGSNYIYTYLETAL